MNCNMLSDSFSGYDAFRDCEFTKITFGDNVTTIGDHMFEDCGSLTNITFSENSQLTSIGNYAFEYCGSLTDITIPRGVTNIGDHAFRNCRRLEILTIYAVVPPTIGNNTFDRNPRRVKVYVPIESVEAYKSDENWAYFFSKFIGMETSIEKTEVTIQNSELIYDFQGRQVEQPVKGINIVKMKDGSVRKILVK